MRLIGWRKNDGETKNVLKGRLNLPPNVPPPLVKRVASHSTTAAHRHSRELFCS